MLIFLAMAQAAPTPEALVATGGALRGGSAPLPQDLGCDPDAPALTAIEADQQRIRAHLARVEADLRATPVDHLAPAQRANRAAALDTLNAYREAGAFPHNEEVLGRVPVFRDASGRDCAVGALVRASGRADLADAVDADWHLAKVHDMDAPALAAWGAANGFTVDELARIQPSYCMCEDDDVYAPVCGSDGITYWNTCVAETCGGVEPTQGACPYEREACPDYVATEPPAVTACDDMHMLCSEDPVSDGAQWSDWLAAQDQACLESTGEQFDGPDDPPAGDDTPGDDTPGDPAATCAATPPATPLLGLLLAVAIRRRR